MQRRNIFVIFVALCLVAGGLASLGIHIFGWNPQWFAGWWTLIIMAAAVASMIARGLRFWNVFLLGGALLTLARCQLRYLDTDEKFWGSLGAFALILLGVTLIVNLFRPRKIKMEPPAPAPPYIPPAPDVPPVSAKPAKGDFPTCVGLFNNEVYSAKGKRLRGGQFTSIFGNVTADLRDAEFTQPVVIEAVSIFGSVEILAPPDVRVECTGTAVFGSCDPAGIIGRPYDSARPAMKVAYTCVFGGVKVR